MTNSIYTITATNIVYPQLNIQCNLVHPRAKLPNRAHPTDAGADLYSCEDITIAPGNIRLVDTGIGIKVPAGYVGLIYNRSGQGLKGILVANSVGVIDSDYRGNLKVALLNTQPTEYKIKEGDRIAQLVIQKIELATFSDIWNDTARGTGGFGSTGTQ